MLEVIYRSPEDQAREARISQFVVSYGGWLSFRETETNLGDPICLTYEFDSRSAADSVKEHLLLNGEHVDGPCDY